VLNQLAGSVRGVKRGSLGWTAAALSGIAITAGVTWGASQLFAQPIGLASVPLSVVSRLAPATTPAAARPAPPVITFMTPQPQTSTPPRPANPKAPIVTQTTTTVTVAPAAPGTPGAWSPASSPAVPVGTQTMTTASNTQSANAQQGGGKDDYGGGDGSDNEGGGDGHEHGGATTGNTSTTGGTNSRGGSGRDD